MFGASRSGGFEFEAAQYDLDLLAELRHVISHGVKQCPSEGRSAGIVGLLSKYQIDRLREDVAEPAKLFEQAYRSRVESRPASSLSQLGSQPANGRVNDLAGYGREAKSRGISVAAPKMGVGGRLERSAPGTALGVPEAIEAHPFRWRGPCLGRIGPEYRVICEWGHRGFR